MDFIDEIRQFSLTCESVKNHISTEEATKTSLIMPFFSLLGYNVFNPQEFLPEYTADVGIKKGEKVDYAIMNEQEPIILIEAKSVQEKLQKHDSQLFRYFGTSKAKFGILTNGIEYRFFTDLEEPNKMDENPFLTINILDVKENQVAELKKFKKTNFNIEEIFTVASELKYANAFKAMFIEELDGPSDEMVKLFLNSCYSGLKTQSVVERFRPVLKKSLHQYINETMNDKIKNALVNEKDEIVQDEINTQDKENIKKSKIITTPDELEAFFVVKHTLKEIIDIDNIYFKDTESYFGIIYNNNVRKWICRIDIQKSQIVFMTPNQDGTIEKNILSNIYEIEKHKNKLIEIVNKYI